MSWQDQAACNGADPGLFFPETKEDEREAQRICAECPVRVDCLEHAYLNGEKHGVWGGMTERERNRGTGRRSGKCPVCETKPESPYATYCGKPCRDKARLVREKKSRAA